ncbi:MAG: transposase [Ferrimicrobium sp.]|nr:transposase [Ferrimicrobium sp.]
MRAGGTACFAYNWRLARWKERYEAHKADPSVLAPSQYLLRCELNSIKREPFPWMMDVTKCAPQEALIDLGSSFDNFFKGRGRYPKFKKKGICDSFSLSSGTFGVDPNRVRIPKFGYVRMSEPLRFDGRILSATVSRRTDQWFVSFAVEVDDSSPTIKTKRSVGVDLGVKTLATLSNGEKSDGPKAQAKLLKKQHRLSKQLSRKQKGSKNRHKAQLKLARLNARIADIGNDSLHKLTTELASNYEVICIEALHVPGMVNNHNLARAVSDMGFFEFKRQLSYKCEKFGSQLVIIDRWYPSSKTCSACGRVAASMPLSVREWTCDGCGASHDRDTNAASSAGSNDCGEESSGQTPSLGLASGETGSDEAVSELQTYVSGFV